MTFGLEAGYLKTLVSFHMRPEIGAELFDALTHALSVTLNSCNIENKGRRFYRFEFHGSNSRFILEAQQTAVATSSAP
jgi:hypothetical protein